MQTLMYPQKRKFVEIDQEDDEEYIPFNVNVGFNKNAISSYWKNGEKRDLGAKSKAGLNEMNYSKKMKF